MPKLGMQPVRRAQIIEATIKCVANCGLHKSSMQAIATEAGMTSSLIVHYFGDRTGIYEAVYAHLYQQVIEEVRRQTDSAETSFDRAAALCLSQLDDKVLTGDIAVTWVALYALIPEIPSLARLEGIYSQRIKSNLIHHLRRSGMTQSDGRAAAAELLPLIDGLWLRKAAQPDTPNAELRSIVCAYIDRHVARPQTRALA